MEKKNKQDLIVEDPLLQHSTTPILQSFILPIPHYSNTPKTQ